MTNQPISSPDAARSGRAVGAMFFSVFGGAWLTLWAVGTFEQLTLAAMVLGALTVLLLWASWRVHRRYRHAPGANATDPERKRVSRLFNWINATQWVAIIGTGLVLAKLGQSAWTLPATLFIVGLHFLPMAAIFKYQPHRVTGIALMLVAVVYPLMAPQGPRSAVGCLGAGIVLWVSAIWALRFPSRTP